MRGMQKSGQTQTEAKEERSTDMNGTQQGTQIQAAPLYASPWLAFYVLIRQGLAQLWP